MMEKIHFYFFCLYNSLYKDGFYLESYLKTSGLGRMLPQDRAILGLFFSTYLWTYVFRLTIIILIHPNFRIIFWGFQYELIISIIIYGVYFYYFINNNRFSNIYSNFKATDKNLQRREVKKIYWVLGLPLILIPLICWLISSFMDIDLTKC